MRTCLKLYTAQLTLVFTITLSRRPKQQIQTPISGSILCEKAVQLSGLLGNSNFKASNGWRWRFCKHHGIRELSLQGEKLSAVKDAADKFIPEFKKVCEEKCLSLHQIFNCDKTGLNFCLLSQSSLA